MAIIYPNTTIQEMGGKLNLSGGTIVQVVEARSSATLGCANWSTQNFLFSGTITPLSTSNKILLYLYTPFRFDAGQGTWSLAYIWVNNNAGSNIITSGWNGSWRNTITSYEKYYLDSPASTSAQTYSVYVGNYPTGTCYYGNNSADGNASDGYSYLRLTEIAG